MTAHAPDRIGRRPRTRSLRRGLHRATTAHCRGVILGALWLAATGPVTVLAHDSTDAEVLPPDEVVFDLGDGLDDIDLLELEVPMVVTANRRVQPITHIPQAISIISAEDIRATGARTIGDALRLAAGVDVADLGMSQQAISIRGSSGFLANTLLVLVDGRQIFDSVFGGTVWNSWPFLIEDIERIEVQRGPGGVTWGANAMNGVINIITKNPGNQLGFRLVTGAATRGTVEQYFGYGLHDDKLHLRVSAGFGRTDGYRDGGHWLTPLDDRQSAGSFSLYGVHQSSPQHTLVVSAGARIVDGGLADSPLHWPFEANTGSSAYYLLGRWHHREDADHESEISAYINTFQIDAGSRALAYAYQQLALQYMRTVRPHEAHTLTWGIDTRLDLVDASNAEPIMLSRDHVHSGIVGIYLQEEWRFAPRWSLNLGGRLDYDSYGGFEPSARAALAFELSETSLLFASAARSFAMPPAASRFLNTPLLGQLAYVTADRDMDARTVLAYELGYRGRFWDRMDLSAGVFWHEYADFLALPVSAGPPGLMRLNFQNAADASAYGVELESRVQATERLELLANYTYQVLDWRSDTPYHLTETITPPRHKAMAGVRYRLTDDIRLSTHMYFVDSVLAPRSSNPFMPRDVDAYLRWDVRGEWAFWEDRATLAVGVRNLLDQGHFEGGTLFLNDAQTPRMLFTELRIAIPAGDQ